MTRRFVLLVLLITGFAGSARAFLPPDASAREPQIRAYRQQVRKKYEERLVERQAEAVRAYQRTQADIFTPPWMRSETQAALMSGDGASVSGSEETGERNHRFLVSFVLLILLGAVAVWIRHVTREIDE